MKIRAFKFLFLSTLLFLFSCSGGDSPKAVAEKYLKAIGSYDFDAAKKYGTEDTGKLLEMMSGFAKMVPDSTKDDIRFTILEERIEGEKAVVVYKEEGEEAEVSLNLLKVEGKWKVNMTKESINEAESGNTMDVGATQTDTSGSK
ncbi:MAG TPA: DUF4878 domain-containing protein [Bacteroidia bacterium]|nr:DUF4878 domain-containing protein [Bacteroidia bacterium]HNS11098.1 DUF4878 domain-containing protein [Bacteroidia bacterium]